MIGAKNAMTEQPEAYTYRCAHCLHPLLTSQATENLEPIRLFCPRCGGLNTFRVSVISQAVELPPNHQCGHQCDPSIYTSDRPLLGLLLRKNMGQLLSSASRNPHE